MRVNRRPILILVLLFWIICLWYVERSWLWLWPGLILLSFREKNSWLVFLLIIRLVLLPDASYGPYAGEAEAVPVSFSRANQWVIEIDDKSYLYQGSLSGSGLYLIDGQREGFRRHRQITGYSEHDYYLAQGIVGRISLSQSKQLKSIAEPFRIRLQNDLYDQLSGFGESQNLAFALLFGGSRLLDETLVESLKQVGLLHLMVVSGLHLQIYERAVERLLSWFRLPRIARRVIICGLLLGLLIVTDYHPSCLRSVGLFGLREICFWSRKRIDNLDQLALVTCFMLLINPYWASGTGFLLGALAHGSLSYPQKPSVLRLYLIMLPFQLLLNGFLSPVYLLANLGLAMIMNYALPVLLVTLIVKPWQFLTGLWLRGLTSVIYLAQGVKLFKLEVMIPSGWLIGLVLFVYCGLLLSLQSKTARELLWRFRLGFSSIFLVVLISTTMLHQAQMRGVHFLQVGQGDASIIMTETGKSILIDTGKSTQLFDHLRYFGISRLDLLIISHRDDDHAAWVDELDFKQGYTSRETPLANFLPLSAGDVIELDGVFIQVLHPHDKQASENDNSLVLRVEAFGDAYLFGGDVSGELVNPLWFDEVMVYKFPHHGSIHSLASLSVERAVPFIVFSYGYNRYQHPHPVVIEYFSNSLSHETYLSGSIQFRRGHYRTR